MAKSESKAPAVALLASPGMGHIIPMGEFAKKLALDHGFSVTIYFATFEAPAFPPQQAYIDSLPSSITSILLPPVHLDPDKHDQLSSIFQTVSDSIPNLKPAVEALAASSKLVALVVDPFSTEAFDMAKDLGLKSYIFYTGAAVYLSYAIRFPEIDKSMVGEYNELKEPIRLPGCFPLNGCDVVYPPIFRRTQIHSVCLRNCERYMEADGIFLNSFLNLEPGAIGGLKENGAKLPPIYPVGPLVIREQELNFWEDESSECFSWLEKQPVSSVIFVSFGSLGVLPPEQTTELAMGLELSKQRFIWVARGVLPEGFVQRIAGVGMVVPSWAPQAQILGHPSIGGFLSHCGWNSSLESMVHGLPMIAWPLYAEQRVNAVMLVEELGVGLRARMNESGVVGREEVARLVQELIDGVAGKEARIRMHRLKEAAAAAMATGGSSRDSLLAVVNDWKR